MRNYRNHLNKDRYVLKNKYEMQVNQLQVKACWMTAFVIFHLETVLVAAFVQMIRTLLFTNKYNKFGTNIKKTFVCFICFWFLEDKYFTERVEF